MFKNFPKCLVDVTKNKKKHLSKMIFWYYNIAKALRIKWLRRKVLISRKFHRQDISY